MSTTRRVILALIWLLVLIGAGYAISQRLQVSGDLRISIGVGRALLLAHPYPGDHY